MILIRPFLGMTLVSTAGKYIQNAPSSLLQLSERGSILGMVTFSSPEIPCFTVITSLISNFQVKQEANQKAPCKFIQKLTRPQFLRGNVKETTQCTIFAEVRWMWKPYVYSVFAQKLHRCEGLIQNNPPTSASMWKLVITACDIVMIEHILTYLTPANPLTASCSY